jgi:hypothetical protein
MRALPEHDRAVLHADAALLRESAARLETLTDDLPADHGPDWTGILVTFAERCRVAADELEAAAALITDDAPDRTRAALAFAQGLLRIPALARPAAAVRGGRQIPDAR